jgi:hypothetical protein
MLKRQALCQWGRLTREIFFDFVIVLFRCSTGITGCVAKLHSVDNNQIKLLIYRIQRIDVYRERYDATQTVSPDSHPHTRS